MNRPRCSPSGRSTRSRWLAACLAVALLAACNPEIDMTRPEIERGTLGQEIYGQLERDIARTRFNSAAKADAFRSHRDEFIWAVDTLFPEGEIDRMDQLTVDLLPLIDDDMLPSLVRKLATLYDDIGAMPEVTEAWERSDRLRQGYAHDTADSEVIRRILEYPRLRELTDFTVDLILEHDGIDDLGNPDPREVDFMFRLQQSMRDSMLAPADPVDLSRNIVVVTEFLLQPEARFVDGVTVQPMWGVRPDARGLPRITFDDGATLPALFVDGNGDRLPDVNHEGAFVDRQQRSFFIQPYGAAFQVENQAGMRVGRDELGRAFYDDGDFVYQYVDLNETSLGYVMRRTPELVERGVVTDTFIGLEGLLGELDTTGPYPRFTANNAVLDLMDALFQVAEFDDVPALLEGVSELLDEHEVTLATLLVVMDENSGINDEFEAALEPDNAFVDDLLPYILELAQHKGLLDDLLTALQDPMTQRLQVAFGDLIRYANPAIRPDLDGPYNSSVAFCLDTYNVGTPERFDCLRGSNNAEIFTAEVDHTASELDGNISLQQRLLHLIYDGSGVPFHMEIVELSIPALGLDLTDVATDLGPLLTIDDVAAAFFDSIAGNFCLEDTVNVERIEENGLLSALITIADVFGAGGEAGTAGIVTELVVLLSDRLGVHLDPCPTPGQLLRFFNLPSYDMELLGAQTSLALGIDKEGYVFQFHQADALYAAEAAGALDALRPILQPISDRGLSPLMGRLIADLYRHYPEPDVVYSQADGTASDFVYSAMRRYEPALQEIFDRGRMLPIVSDLTAAIQSLEPSGGESATDVVELMLVHLLDPEAGVSGRNGETTATRGDGQPTPMTRFYLLVDTMDALDESLADSPAANEAWERAADEMVDLLLETVELPDGTGVFEDRGSPALGTVLTGHLARYLRGHKDSGDLFRRLREDYPAYMADLVTSRGFAAAVQLVRDVRDDPADQELFDHFLCYLTEETGLTTRSGLALLYELLLGTTDQVGYVQVAPFYANLVDPERRFDVGAHSQLPFLTHAALVLREMLAVDPDDVGIDMLRRGLVPPPGADEAPLSVLARVIRQVHRTTPGDDGLMTAEDRAHLYARLSEFIRNDFSGMERVFRHIQSRTGER